jgi:hypothetical protein
VKTANQDCGVIAQCQELVKRANEELGGLDVIIGNAVCVSLPIACFMVFLCVINMFHGFLSPMRYIIRCRFANSLTNALVSHARF